mgnify:CR=1 FL=1
MIAAGITIEPTGVTTERVWVMTSFHSYTRLNFKVTNGTRRDFLLRFNWDEILATDDAAHRYDSPSGYPGGSGTEQRLLGPGESYADARFVIGSLAPAAKSLTLRFGTVSGAPGPALTYALP